MSRFYQTSKGSHVDYMFKPNYEMMETILNKKTKDVDNILTEGEIISTEYDKVKSLNIEADVNRIKEKKEEYDTKVDDITNRVLDNVLDASKYAPQIENLKKEIQTDLTTGQTSKVIARYQSFQNMLEENKDLLETDPTTYNQMLGYYYNQVKEGADVDPNFVFNPQKFVGRPELFGDDFNEIMKNLKPEKHSTISGMYFVNNQLVSKERVREIALNELLSSPKYQGYVSQQIMIGETQGLIEGTDHKTFMGLDSAERAKHMIQPVILFNNATGKEITADEYSNMTREQRASVIQMANPSYRFAPDLEKAENIFAYEQSELKANQVAISAADRASKERQAALDREHDIILQQMDFENDKAMKEFEANLALEYENALKGGDKAKAEEIAALQQKVGIGKLFKEGTMELDADVPVNKTTSAKDKSDLEAARKEGKVKMKKNANGSYEYDISSDSPYYQQFIRYKASKDQTINNINSKEKLSFTDVNGKKFVISKREFFKIHGHRSYSEGDILRTAGELMKKNGFTIEKTVINYDYGGKGKKGVEFKYDLGNLPGNTTKNKSNKSVKENGLWVSKDRNNANIASSLAKDMHTVQKNWYQVNQNQETNKREKFNAVAPEHSASIEGQIATLPSSFTYYQNGKKISLTEDEVKILMNTLEAPLMATSINNQGDIAFMTDTGIIIAPNSGEEQVKTTVKNIALAGSSRNSVLYQNEMNQEIKNISQGFYNLGHVNVSSNYELTTLPNYNFRGVNMTIKKKVINGKTTYQAYDLDIRPPQPLVNIPVPGQKGKYKEINDLESLVTALDNLFSSVK